MFRQKHSESNEEFALWYEHLNYKLYSAELSIIFPNMFKTERKIPLITFTAQGGLFQPLEYNLLSIGTLGVVT